MSARPGWRALPGASREHAAIALGLATVALVVTLSGALTRLDHLLFDTGQRIAPQLDTDGVVIVAIDEESLGRIGRWPWSRAVHAQALRTICAANPAVVGVDVAFSEPAADHPADAELAGAVGDCGRVVLPLVIETVRTGGQVLESPPIPSLVAAAAGLGRVGVRLGDDGIARSVDLREGLGTASWPLFAAELLRVAARQPAATGARDVDTPPSDPTILVRRDERRFAFAGPPGRIPRLSFADVLDGNLPRAMFAGKIVLVGATAVGLGDFLPTPLSARAQPMPGVEVQANILLSLRDGRLSRVLPDWAAALCCAVLAILPLAWLPRLMPLAGLGASLGWILLLCVAGALQTAWLPVLVAPSGALVAALLAFPLWSWRRLEAARRHFDHELRQLGDAVDRPAPHSSNALRRMGFDERIAAVQAAQLRLRSLEAERNETLTFISHDLRSPLASAVQRLESEPVCESSTLLPSLRRAHAMAQDFLHTARAEALEPGRMAELDLVGLLEQAADELYPLAMQRGRSIRRVLPDQPVWIKGDFASLERSAINLLQNALNYSPEGDAIGLEVDLSRAPREVRFIVTNVGPAFPPAQGQRLFERFRRGEDAAEQPQGAGLGLYFVRTVAERHGGRAGVDCRDGLVRFWVALPAGESG